MAGLWYRVGTVSVTNGSKKVTGFGTQWKSTVYKPDKGHTFYGPDGKAYEIDYVESDTVLYLVMVYAGATANTQPYAIDITRTSTIPAFSRELSAFTTYAQSQYDSWQQVLTGTGMVTLTAPDGQQIQVPALSAFQPTSASLKALQALTPVKDKLPYFSSTTQAGLTDFPVFAQQLLATATAASGARTKLGLDQLVSLGQVNDLNDITLFSLSSVPGASKRIAVTGYAPANKPPASTSNWFYTEVSPRSTGGNTVYYRQVLVSVSNGETWTRVNTSMDLGATISTFGLWRRDYSQENVVGAVSQSGGIPTGALFEFISTANGVCLKLPEGTMICWATRSFTYGSSAHLQNTWTLPVPHAGGFAISMTMAQLTDTGIRKFNRASPSGGGSSSPAISSAILRLWATSGDTFAAGDTADGIPCLFIGRWYV